MVGVPALVLLGLGPLQVRAAPLPPAAPDEPPAATRTTDPPARGSRPAPSARRSGAAGRGELVVSFHGGKAITLDGDLRLRRAPDTDLVLRDVAWRDESFRLPIYYGIRLWWWVPFLPGWGAGLEFTHIKAIADPAQVVTVSGASDGADAGGRRPIRTYLEAFEITHGHDFLTLDIMRRWHLAPAGSGLAGRLHPYAGAGAGLALPHVEATFPGEAEVESQVARPAARGFAGMRADLLGPLAAFLEYQLAWADVTVDLSDEARVSTDTWTHQLIIGLSAAFGSGRRPAPVTRRDATP